MAKLWIKLGLWRAKSPAFIFSLTTVVKERVTKLLKMPEKPAISGSYHLCNLSLILWVQL